MVIIDCLWHAFRSISVEIIRSRSDALNRQQVSLVLLSACQSAMMGQGEDALGCVAAQLTNRGAERLKARSIARRELSNLLWAVRRALEDKSEDVIEFVDRVSKFLYFLG